MVYLKSMDLSDVDDFVRWRNSEFVRNNFICRREFTRESQIDWVENMIMTGRVKQFIIVDREKDVPIGCVYFLDMNHEHGKAEYGIFIGEQEYAGRGFGTAAGSLALDYAFHTLGLNKVYLRVLAGNKRAVASYKKLGFREEGYFRKDVKIEGEYYDVVFMGILKEEWRDVSI